MAKHGPSGWELAMTAGIVSLAVTLGEERREELLAHSAEPGPGWERYVDRSCDRQHEICSGLGVRYEMKHRPTLRLIVTECECVKYELIYRPLLIPSDRQLGEPEPEAGDPLQTEMC